MGQLGAEFIKSLLCHKMHVKPDFPNLLFDSRFFSWTQKPLDDVIKRWHFPRVCALFITIIGRSEC